LFAQTTIREDSPTATVTVTSVGGVAPVGAARRLNEVEVDFEVKIPTACSSVACDEAPSVEDAAAMSADIGAVLVEATAAGGAFAETLAEAMVEAKEVYVSNP
jgi:hypothetical protein